MLSEELKKNINQKFFDKEDSSWQSFECTVRNKELARELFLSLVEQMESGSIIHMSIFDYPECLDDIFEFIRAHNEIAIDQSSIESFLLKLKEKKALVDANRPLEKSIWHPLLTKEVFTLERIKHLNKSKNKRLCDFLYALSVKLAEPPQKLALAKLSKSRLDELLTYIETRIYKAQELTEGDVEETFAWFVLHDNQKTIKNRAYFLRQGIDRSSDGAIGKHFFNRHHQLTATNIQTALPRSSDNFVFLGAYYLNKRDNSFEVFSEPYTLPNYLADPVVRYIFIPLGNGSHWRAAFIEKQADKLALTIFDSLGQSSASVAQKELIELLESSTDKELSVSTSSPQHLQNNHFSCGHYVVAYAHHLVKVHRDDGYDDKVAESFLAKQETITQVVVDYHDSFFGHERQFQRASREKQRVHKKASPSKYSVSAFDNDSIHSDSESVGLTFFSSDKLELSHQSNRTVNGFEHFHQALGGDIHLEDPLKHRADIIRLREIIARLENKVHFFCFRFLSSGRIKKAQRLQQALSSFLKKEDAIRQHVLADKDIALACDSYRYFGFFNRLINKKTRTRLELESCEKTDSLIK